MSGPFLRSGSLSEFQALGAVGVPLYTVASPVRAAVRKLVSPQVADMLAVPQINEAGNRIDWYAPVAGLVVPFSAATEDERGAIRQHRAEARQQLAEAAARLADADDGRTVHARQFPLVASIPDDDFLYLVGGRPVLTFWGFGALTAPKTAALPVPAAPPPAAAEPSPPPPRRRWPLLFLPLLLLPLALCQDDLACAVAGGTASVPSQMVVLLDTSNSMMLPMAVDRQKARDLTKRAASGDLSAGIELQGLIDGADGKIQRRIGVAKEAIARMISDLPRTVDVGIVTFGSCGGPETLGFAKQGERDSLLATLADVKTKGGTPLAKGLEMAAGLVDGKDTPASILLVSDGEESCRGDPCAMARALHQAKPKLTVNVVDVTGDGGAVCVAELTGGTVFSPIGVKDFHAALSKFVDRDCR